MTEIKTTNERIFDKLETITSQYAWIKGRLDVIDEKFEHKPDYVDMIKFVEKQIEKHENSIVTKTKSNAPPPKKDLTPIIVATLKIVGLLITGGGIVKIIF